MNGQLSDQTRSKNARQSLGIRSTRSSVRSNRLAKAPISLRGGAFGAASIETYSGLRETKAKRARERGYVQLFLSHKAKDQLAATEIFQVLKKAGKRKLEIFMSENVQKGDNRQRDIDEQLHASDWFLFLYTGNYNDDWSWCHHEAGFFRGMMYPDPKRVVVFYPAESISVPNHPNLPDPLKAYQGVRCEKNNPGEIYRFFTDVFAEDPYPAFPAINPSFASDQNIS
jgi:hypothetical protein